MKQIVLDTNFILTCVKQKIDFFEQLLGYEIQIPKQVLAELKRIKSPYKELALKILEKNKFKQIDLGLNYVDKGLVKHAKANPSAIIATLDKELKDKIQNKKMIIRERKRLEATH
ncbi:MAG: hypothetical protein KJ949_01795 [Nanoarchaeota archaeon]|nr:hypothetical protein [Nanoarchaeota archaeon]